VLKVHSITKSYGADPVLDGVSFVLSPGERVGLVGPNGSGKSTLLRIISGELKPDTGHVWLNPADRAAYLPQYPLDELGLTIEQALLRGAGAVGELQGSTHELERAMATAEGAALEALLAEYSETRDRFERLGGYELDARIEQVVDGLGLEAFDRSLTVAALSGGNKTKLSLARLLLSDAGILLLDEPTNYLDLPALLWLERFITESSRSFIVVSHDRRFLDRTVSGILELDLAKHTLRQWSGNYSDYAEARLREEQKRLEAYRDQQAEILRIEEDIRRTREQARHTQERTKSGLGADVQRRQAKKVDRKAKARERRLEKQLAAPTMIEKPVKGWRLHLVDLGRETIADNRTMLEAKNVYAGYDGTRVLKNLALLIRGRDRVALMGENGSGKSTLLRCITGDLPFQGEIKVGPSVRLGFLSQEAEELPLDRSVLEVFRARTEMPESDARAYLHKFLFTGQETLKPVNALSYGQRAKLALAILILSDANFLVLDEPTSHMDMQAVEAIERALEEFSGPLLLVSHDRYFIERIGVNRVEVLEDGTLRAVDSVEAYEDELQDDDDQEHPYLTPL
jgi:ATP-binding cassette subfamily F protein 3